MSALSKLYYTPEQYLEMDRSADRRSEYVDGEILEMAGASREHNLIVTVNILGAALLAGFSGAASCETVRQ